MSVATYIRVGSGHLHALMRIEWQCIEVADAALWHLLSHSFVEVNVARQALIIVASCALVCTCSYICFLLPTSALFHHLYHARACTLIFVLAIWHGAAPGRAVCRREQLSCTKHAIWASIDTDNVRPLRCRLSDDQVGYCTSLT